MGIRAILESISRNIDRKRIRIHLTNTLRDLKAKKIEDIDNDRRNQMIEYLEDYIERGEFPSNKNHNSREPYFKGPNGNLCAVGYLMWRDGEEKLVNKIADKENNIYLENLEEGESVEWIEKSGLTKKEAERIQPSYGPSTYINLATNCGPVSCTLALNAVYLLGSATFLGLEWLSYKHLKSLYPEKPLKKAPFLGLSLLNGFTAIGLAVVIYAFFP